MNRPLTWCDTVRSAIVVCFEFEQVTVLTVERTPRPHGIRKMKTKNIRFENHKAHTLITNIVHPIMVMVPFIQYSMLVYPPHTVV
jgi:hypothetical protein